MKTGMRNRLWKETRAILPVWVITLVLMLAGRLILEFDYGQVWFVWFAYAFGAQFVGAVLFGHEFNHNTIGLLLTQSISRARIYLEKVAVMAIALIGLMTAMALIIWSSVPASRSSIVSPGDTGLMLLLVAALPALIAWCSGPLMTLIMHGTLGGAALAILLPWILVIAPWIFDYYSEASEKWLLGYTFASQSVYALICAILGYLTFLKLEDRGSFTAEAATVTLGALTDKIAGGTGPVPNLIKKELRLHQPVFLLAFVLLAFWAALMIVKWSRPMFPVEYLAIPAAILVVAVPALAGIITVAEERHLGLHDWHLTLAQSSRLQWTIKLGAGFLVNLLVGLILATLLILISQSAFNTTLAAKTDSILWFLLNLWIYSAAAYASSFSANSLRALLGTGIIVCVMVGVWFLPLIVPFASRQPSFRELVYLIIANICFFWVAGLYNFRRTLSPISSLFRQGIWIGLIALFLVRMSLDI